MYAELSIQQRLSFGRRWSEGKSGDPSPAEGATGTQTGKAATCESPDTKQATREMQSRLHVIQLNRNFNPGTGVANVALALEGYLQDQGVQVSRFDMTSARYPLAQRERSNPITRRLFTVAEAMWYGAAASRHVRRIRKSSQTISISHADATRGDIYVNHGLLKGALAKKPLLPRIASTVMYAPLLLREEYRFRKQPHSLVICLTQADAELLQSLYPTNRMPITVIPNGVDLEHFRPPSSAERVAAREYFGLRPENDYILFVGHEVQRKGLPILLEAIKLLPHSHGALVVGGEPAEVLQAIESVGPDLLADGSVLLAGRQPDARAAYWAADAFCLPSAYETGPLVLLEALACGLPCLMTDVGIARSVIVDGINGRIVPRDAQALADAVLGVIGMRRQRMQTAPPSASTDLSRYSWKRAGHAYLRVIRETASKG